MRGRVDNGEIDAETARRIGSGLARYTDAEAVAVGRDCRDSSPALAEALIEGIISCGTDVAYLGPVATEVVYFYSGSQQVPGVVVTASHNPAGYNGFKLCHRGAAPIGTGTGLEDVKRLAREPSDPVRRNAEGRVRDVDAVADYVDHLSSVVDPAVIGPMRVAVDGGNGMAGTVVGMLLDRVGVRMTGLYLEPDGSFPNHPADPSDVSNLGDLVDLVQSARPDLGVAFDGDADRAVFVDDEGKPLSGSATTAIIAGWFLSRHPGAKIVHNLICSKAVSETVRDAGGVPVRTRVGHSFIKRIMAKTGALFGGEHSGHYYFRANYGADSGMLAMLVLMAVLTESGVALSELRRAYEPYASSGEVNTAVRDTEAAIRAVSSAYAAYPQDLLDGLTVDLGDGWFNLRPSNTEPLLRLNVEAPDTSAVGRLVADVKEIVSRFM